MVWCKVSVKVHKDWGVDNQSGVSHRRRVQFQPSSATVRTRHRSNLGLPSGPSSTKDIHIVRRVV